MAIVGARKAEPAAYAYAKALAGAVVQAGGVVVSGGALGIDEAAHEGALEAGGRTWCVAGTGRDHVFPPEHAELFARIAAGPGAMIWPFPPSYVHRAGFLARNGILVALSDAVVIVQAGGRSGALRAASRARKLMRPVWVVPVPPWQPWSGPDFDFAGSRQLLSEGARLLLSTESFLASLGLGLASPPPPRHARALTETEQAIVSATSAEPSHLDAIVERAHLSTQAVSSALLTLALENVVVEGPPGFFRRALARKR